MDFQTLVLGFEELLKTSKRGEKTWILAQILKKTPKEQLPQVILLLQGRVFPVSDTRNLGIAAQYVIKALVRISGYSKEEIQQIWNKLGDLGDVAHQVLANKKQQALSFDTIDIDGIIAALQKLPQIEGTGAIEQKIQIISDVLTKSTPLEAKYAIRLILEVMRVGVAQGTLRDALLWAYFPPITFIYTLEENQYKPVLISTKDALKESDEEGAIHIESIDQLPSDVSNIPIITTPDEKIAREVYNHFSACIQHALDVTNDFGLVTTLAAEQNTDELTKIVPDGSAPLQVMLAKKAKSTTEAFEMVGKPAQLEYKYDGFRIQIHKKDNEIKLFTRRLENVTKQFPEVVDYVRDYIKGDSFILDSEAVGYDPKAKKYMPFQKVSQRIRRKYDIEKLQKELPVEVLVFDVIMHNGENWLDKVLTERRKLLESIIQEQPQKVRCSIKTITDSEEEANTFYAASLAAGNEGLMFKSLDSVYKPGSRVGHMVKLKPIMDTLDLVVVGAQWGEGKRASFLTSFTLACIDDTGQLLTIGKVGTGFKELEGEGVSFAYMTEMLKPLIIKDLGKEVEVKPKLVLEIAYEEIQKSPSYKSGFALRFPRLVQVHETRDVNSASSLDVVESYFEGQNEN